MEELSKREKRWGALLAGVPTDVRSPLELTKSLKEEIRLGIPHGLRPRVCVASSQYARTLFWDVPCLQVWKALLGYGGHFIEGEYARLLHLDHKRNAAVARGMADVEVDHQAIVALFLERALLTRKFGWAAHSQPSHPQRFPSCIPSPLPPSVHPASFLSIFPH